MLVSRLTSFNSPFNLMPNYAIFCYTYDLASGDPIMNMNISLPDELAEYIKGKVSAGRYSSSSEVVREALRLMERVEQRELEKLQYLRQAWQQGIDSGDAGEVDFLALKQEARDILATKAL
jgi:antitoxin ParD1/3/4